MLEPSTVTTPADVGDATDGVALAANAINPERAVKKSLVQLSLMVLSVPVSMTLIRAVFVGRLSGPNRKLRVSGRVSPNATHS